MILPHLRHVIFHILYLDICPDSHPYAYSHGRYCCASEYEKIFDHQEAFCDGGIIQYNSMCCENDEYIRCPSLPHATCSNTSKVLER